MFTVFNVHQLATVAAGDVCHHEVLDGLLLRIVIIVGAAGETNTDAPVDLAVGAVDVVDDMVRDQDIAIVDGDVPLDRIPWRWLNLLLVMRAPSTWLWKPWRRMA